MNESPSTSPLQSFPVGRVINSRYEVIEHLGDGGMGFVIKCQDLTLNREMVALKFLHPEVTHDLIARFRGELIMSRQFSHPRIVKMFDIAESEEGYRFISMEYIEGETLEQKLERAHPAGLPIREIVHYLIQIADGLAHAHEHQVIHRDIKPSNIIVTPTGDIKIVDFGIARLVSSTERHTRTGDFVGTKEYTSPEQAFGRNIDHRSDIYSLGIMAFHLVCGHLPFDTQNIYTSASAHLTQPLPPVTSQTGDLPFWLRDAIRKAAAKKPEDRFQSAREMQEYLESFSRPATESTIGRWIRSLSAMLKRK